MDISTDFMGQKIKSPLIVSSSGLTATVENIKKCEKAGAGAVILKSLFEEQLVSDKDLLFKQDDMYFWYPEAVNYVGEFSKEHGIEEYLRLIENAKKSVQIPVVASINCVTPREWPAFAGKIENAGADGLELNIFIPPTDINLTGYRIEETYLEIVREVKKFTSIPVSVKIGYYFTNIFRTVFKLSNLEIKDIILFNRYYRPDIDIEKIQVISNNVFSNPDEITLTLRWIALLSGKVNCDLIAATGIHDYAGVAKHILAGASAVQVCSTLYTNGIDYLNTIAAELKDWMKRKNYSDINSFKGLITKSEENCVAFERVQFMRKTTGKL